MEQKVLGTHYTFDLYGCYFETLNDSEEVKSIIHNVIEKIGAKLVAESYKMFSPIGISGYAIISESHISIHTWPEYQFAAVDIFSCKKIITSETIEYIKQCFKAEKCNIHMFERGTIELV